MKKALERQRDILSRKLDGSESVLTQEIIIACLLDIGIIFDNNQGRTIQRFGVLGRLLDNLLDDEGVDHRKLEKEIISPTLITELSDFYEHLTPNVLQDFKKQGALAVRIMALYNRNPSHRFRLMESRILARLYVTLLGKTEKGDTEKGDTTIEDHLYHFIAAGYMFCDLKHIKKDKTGLSNIKTIGFLLKETILYLKGIQNYVFTLKSITIACSKSIQVEFTK